MARNSQERMELLARLLKERGIEKPKRQTIPRRQAFGDPPLSFDQQRLWFLDQFEPGTSLYNDCVCLRIDGVELNRELFQEAVDRIVARHAVLRTWFTTSPSGQPIQCIKPGGRVPVHFMDLRELPEMERPARVEALLREDVRKPFYLDQPPLLRATLLQVADKTYEFGLTMHHIISDGVSYGVFYEELAEIYGCLANEVHPGLPELPVQYGDYAAWERKALDAQHIQSKLGYWADKLEKPPLLALTCARERTGQKDHAGAFHRFKLPEGLYRSLDQFCKREGVTSYWVLLASYFAALHRFSNQTDILIGTPSSCRKHVELESLIGFFVHTVPIRNDLDGNPTFRELIERTRTIALEAHDHDDVPFDRMVQALRKRGFGGELIQAWFAHMRDMIPTPSIHGSTTSYHIVDGGNARFDLCLIMDETQAGIEAYFEYDLELFEPATVARIADQFMATIQHCTDHPDTSLSLLVDYLRSDEPQKPARRPLRKLQGSRRITRSSPRKEAS